MLLLLKSVSNWQPFPKIGNNRNTMHQVIDRKSFQWLGATVATGRDSDMIVVSAFVFIMYAIYNIYYRNDRVSVLHRTLFKIITNYGFLFYSSIAYLQWFIV